MTGKVTKQLLEKGEYPKCLSETFTEAKKLASGEEVVSPMENYFFSASMGRVLFWFFFFGPMFFISHASSVLFRERWGKAVAENAVGMIGLLAVAALFFAGFSKWLYRRITLRSFERHLKAVLAALKFTVIPRPVHLMMVEEVKALAGETLVTIGFLVLKFEREKGKGCSEAVGLSNRMGAYFDLFKEHGLVADPNKKGYKPFYEEAEKRTSIAPISPESVIREDPECYTVDELCQRLGASEEEVKRLVTEGEILGVCRGDETVFSRQWVEHIAEQVESGKVKLRCLTDEAKAAPLADPKPEKKNPASAKSSREFYTFDEVLMELKIDEQKLKRLVAEGEIRAYREGDEMRFKRFDVDSLKGLLSHEQLMGEADKVLRDPPEDDLIFDEADEGEFEEPAADDLDPRAHGVE